MSNERRHPSAPGIPGQRLPGVDSVPPVEKIMRELSMLEGRMLGRLADQHTEAKEERTVIREQMRELRDHVATLAKAQTDLTNAVLAGRTTDVELTRDVGNLKTRMVAAGAKAGAKKGILAAIGTVLVAIGGKWLAQKLGLDL